MAHHPMDEHLGGKSNATHFYKPPQFWLLSQVSPDYLLVPPRTKTFGIRALQSGKVGTTVRLQRINYRTSLSCLYQPYSATLTVRKRCSGTRVRERIYKGDFTGRCWVSSVAKVLLPSIFFKPSQLGNEKT